MTAAAWGGAYGGARHGAYGRLLAWTSVRAMLGFDPGAPIHVVAASAAKARWFAFDLDMLLQACLAVVDPEKRRLAIVAAVDTD